MSSHCNSNAICQDDRGTDQNVQVILEQDQVWHSYQDYRQDKKLEQKFCKNW